MHRSWTAIRVVFFLALSLLSTVGARAEAPFRDLPFAEALKAAGKEKKLVMVDFYATWCGPCKMLDKNTWKDPKVQEWLAQKTIPLKIDAEKQRDLANQYKVQAYPTMVFIEPDGKVRGRLRGYLAPQQFLTQAEATTSGDGAVGVARAALKGRESDPNARLALAEALAEADQPKEALEHYLWLYDNGVAQDPRFAQARATVVLGAITEISKKERSAREALAVRRAGLVEQILSARTDASTLDDLPRLDVALDQRDSTLALFDRLKRKGEGYTDARRKIGIAISDLLYEKRRYRDFVECTDNMAGRLESLLSRAVTAKASADSLPSGDRKRVFVEQQLVAVANASLQGYEALLGSGQRAESDRVAQGLLALDGGSAMFERLAVSAERAGESGVAEKWRGLIGSQSPGGNTTPADSLIRFDEG